MNPTEYISGALRTCVPVEPVLARLNSDPELIDLLHAYIGLTTEGGELFDGLKKHIFYGKPLDKTNAIEELGDMFWYLAIAANYFEVSFEEIMRINNAKLKARYPEKFTEDKAINRNLKLEREVLENA